MKVSSSHTNASSTWQHVVKKYSLDDTGDHQRVTNLLRMKWLIHHITLLIENHGTLGIHVCIPETQYMLISLVSVQVVYIYEGVLKSNVLRFLCGYTYLNETITGNFLNFIVHFYTVISSLWSPLQSTDICQHSSSFVSPSQQNCASWWQNHKLIAVFTSSSNTEWHPLRCSFSVGKRWKSRSAKSQLPVFVGRSKRVKPTCSNLYSYSCTCVQSSIITLKECWLDVRMNSPKSCFHLS